ncbi:MAG: tat pathway signal sequence, partial [Kutzneria sp.]|nr:tat pathway signal sequence [Kutzneria sp.]
MTGRTHRGASLAMTVATAVAVCACGVAGKAVAPVARPVATTSASPAAKTADPTAAAATPTCSAPGVDFDCDLRNRIAAAQAYVNGRPGSTGIVLRDRRTGAVWRNDAARRPVWTASTIKLAMVVDLLLRDRAGTIALSGDDRALIGAMLNSSDDKAADTLWFRYAGKDHMAFNSAFPRYGMTSLQPQRGFSTFYPYWGFQKCTPDDLDRLINYVLTELPANLRDYLVAQLRSVAPIQQWGVWGAGPAARPGNKDGWSLEQGGWVMNTVG